MIGDESIRAQKDIFFFGPKLRFEFSEKGSVQISTLNNEDPGRILAQLSPSEWEDLVLRQRSAVTPVSSFEPPEEEDEPTWDEVDPGVEYRRSVVLSTGHLTYATSLIGDRLEDPEGKVLFPWTYGYMAYAYQERTALFDIPDDLWACCEWANAQAMEPGEPIYIFFDRDGPQVEGLPYYDW